MLVPSQKYGVYSLDMGALHNSNKIAEKCYIAPRKNDNEMPESILYNWEDSHGNIRRRDICIICDKIWENIRKNNDQERQRYDINIWSQELNIWDRVVIKYEEK